MRSRIDYFYKITDSVGVVSLIRDMKNSIVTIESFHQDGYVDVFYFDINGCLNFDRHYINSDEKELSRSICKKKNFLPLESSSWEVNVEDLLKLTDELEKSLDFSMEKLGRDYFSKILNGQGIDVSPIFSNYF